MELVGQRFGHIRVTASVGEGGMGEVYAGYDETLQRKVALKVLHADYRLDEEARERLLREARALSKLDHPNICRIHDYIEHGDSDLLVLEFIDGRTLDTALHDHMARAEKLRIAISIAEVLVAAHREGIVHRDLKPDNVMLTQTGEVKVLDFGLARWLNPGRRRHSSDTHIITPPPLLKAVRKVESDPDVTSVLPPPRRIRTEERQFMNTAVGITMGTPMYMSPEQARGETLTPASDMFSFGLLLQFLFSGVEAHHGIPDARTMMLRVGRGETNPVQGVSGDITAVINRLKSFAPADRLTAVEALERLQHLAEKPQRIVRRSIAAVLLLIAIIAGWRYTVDLQRARAIAEEARAEAVENEELAAQRRDQAENLIEFMIGDLRTKLEPVGRLDILDDVAIRVNEYVAKLDPQTLTASELARNAKALNQLGNVRMELGRMPEALELFHDSLKLAEAAVKREPRNPDALLTRGATEFWIADVLRRQGKHDEALEHMRAYMRDGDMLVAIDPKNDEYQRERGYGHSGVGFVLEIKGRFEEAAKHYHTALQVSQLLASRKPEDSLLKEDLAASLNKVGVNLFNQGDLRGSTEYMQREVSIYRTLVALEPKQTQWKDGLSVALVFLGRNYELMGDKAAALRLYREGLRLMTELAVLDPANVEWQRKMAVSMMRVGTLDESDAGLALLRQARTKIDDAIRNAPERKSYAVDRAVITARHGRILALRGDSRGAAMLRESVQMLEQIPEDRTVKLRLGWSLLFLGEAIAPKRPQAAAELWTRATQVLPPAESTGSAEELADRTRLLLRLNRTEEARGMLEQLKRNGYATAELEGLCPAQGC